MVVVLPIGRCQASNVVFQSGYGLDSALLLIVELRDEVPLFGQLGVQFGLALFDALVLEYRSVGPAGIS
ncbi:hypothetical protein [Spirosoma sordidisoli]|uniref:hypothetical protein n=1 Tax=Spirosoma sordidisoli TaxID=2502893 RepID=UPI0013EC3F31|nr:hypothetical protein [Spirosoma sordidisoli]